MKAAVLAFVIATSSVAAGGGQSVSRPADSFTPVQDKEPPVVCGFRNPSYTGLCEERAPYEKGKQLEAICKPILDCLNNTRCIKTYCGATTIRQGWTLESATRAK
jgi:hypothetical protein